LLQQKYIFNAHREKWRYIRRNMQSNRENQTTKNKNKQNMGKWPCRQLKKEEELTKYEKMNIYEEKLATFNAESTIFG